WGLGGGIHAAKGPAIGEGTAPDSWLVVNRKQVIACIGQFAAQDCLLGHSTCDRRDEGISE
ncbi:hypothetical protein, partial [Xanthomonas phaseoli]|uniref:hypothetical protein n=1 Tax=Xanthomonas phaseoli TaxID=1985254 RepID=UPI0004927EB7